MKSSCINHPEREALIIIRKWQVDVCGGNHCAAALLSFFEYWHNWKLDMQSKASHANRVAKAHGDEPTQDETLLQFHTTTQLSEGLLGLFGETKIRTSLEFLADQGFISVHKNPNPRYKFDQTKYFLFHPDHVFSIHQKQAFDSSKTTDRDVKSTGPVGESTGTITETPSKITAQTTDDCADVASDEPRTALAVAKKPKPTSEQTEANKATWEAYAGAYERRYGAKPIRNAQTNGIIAKFVKSVDMAEAPLIARYYINLNTDFYVKQLHPVSLLLKDANAIRTQWATNRQVTSASARNLDKQQATLSGIDEYLREKYGNDYQNVVSEQ